MWRAGVIVVGGVFVLGGLVLVPLPGPGWLIVFFGLAIWGTEFVWAQRLLTWVRATVSDATNWILRQPRWLRVAGGIVTIAVVVAVVGAYWNWMGWWPLNGGGGGAQSLPPRAFR